MKVLVACEYSGVVRDAFLRRGHDAISCDLLATESPGLHYQGDVRDVLNAEAWDLLIAHPDCTYLTCAAEWAYGDGPYHQKVKPETLVGTARRRAREEALDFVRLLLSSRAKRKCIENPAIGAINTRIRKPSQIIHPHQFGHDASKKTGLWLENLPPLVSTRHIPPRMVGGLPRWANQTDAGENNLGPSKDRWKKRSLTYFGIADAMAEQWGKLLP